MIKSIKELVLLSIASYKGLAGQNIQSLGWNFVMVKVLSNNHYLMLTIKYSFLFAFFDSCLTCVGLLFISSTFQYKCCGLNDYKDFLSSNWTRSVTTSVSTYTLKTPVACCDPLPTSGDLTCATTTSEPNTALTVL